MDPTRWKAEIAVTAFTANAAVRRSSPNRNQVVALTGLGPRQAILDMISPMSPEVRALHVFRDSRFAQRQTVLLALSSTVRTSAHVSDGLTYGLIGFQVVGQQSEGSWGWGGGLAAQHNTFPV
jgi:thiamine monophosphate kinase